MARISLFRPSKQLMNHFSSMKILGAFGIGVFLVVLAALLPSVFAELSKTLVVVLRSIAEAFTAAGILASYAGQP